jgi:hypothetical protein
MREAVENGFPCEGRVITGLKAYDSGLMSARSYSRCWIHLIWGTLNREKLLNKTAAAVYLSFSRTTLTKKAST